MKYLELIYKLLPPGSAWQINKDSVLYRLIDGLAAEFQRFENRFNVLIREMDLQQTSELLTEWETAFGLPENCMRDMTFNEAQRRENLVTKASAVGGSSPWYFIQLAARNGYTVSITESGNYQWAVNGPAVDVTYFRTGVSSIGDRLGGFGDNRLECLINRYKPAHTDVNFTYGT